jgi:hypothetical protein
LLDHFDDGFHMAGVLGDQRDNSGENQQGGVLPPCTTSQSSAMARMYSVDALHLENLEGECEVEAEIGIGRERPELPF